MKKIRITAILIVFIITYCVGLTGCGSIKDTSGILENHSSINKTNETSIPDYSTDTAMNIPAQPSSSSSGNRIDEIDYNQYLKKVWVMKTWINDTYNSSICISKIENGKIEGKLSTLAIAVPDYYYYLPGHLGYLGNLTGSVNNGIAECQFNDKNGDKGNVKLVFKTKNEIEATIKYTDKSQNNKDINLEGTFLFKPYNLKDIQGFSPFNDQSFTVDLNSWGTVKFVSGKILGGNHIPTVAYLTNKDGDIYYDFTSFIPSNVEFYAISFKDTNKDGLKDIIIIYGVEEDSSSQLAKIFFQKADASFYDNGDLEQEINDSGNNKDIKTIMDYISKKF